MRNDGFDDGLCLRKDISISIGVDRKHLRIVEKSHHRMSKSLHIFMKKFPIQQKKRLIRNKISL